MIPRDIQSFLDHALPVFQADEKILGLAATGSYARGSLDEFSDLDLTVVVDARHLPAVVRQGPELAASLGKLLVSFTGEHVGLPSLRVCLFEDPLLHVDLHFIEPEALRTRTEEPVVLWERGSFLSSVLNESEPVPPTVDLQWIEDRFWVWMHYAAQRLGRGELFEVVDTLGFLRQHVLGPLLLQKAGRLPFGVRRLELASPGEMESLRATLAGPNVAECEAALKAAAKFYLDLREQLDSGALTRHRRAEMVAMRYLHEMVEGKRAEV